MNPSLLLIPDRYKAAKLYSQIPDSGAGDLTFARNSNATRENSAGLIEKVRTNNYLYSNTFTDAAWTNLRMNFTASAAANPLTGTNDAFKASPSTDSGLHAIRQTIVYGVLSIYAKKGENEKIGFRDDGDTGFYATFNLDTGVLIEKSASALASITALSGGWYRVQFAVPTSSSKLAGIYFLDNAYTSGSPVSNTYAGNGTDGLFIYASQAETGDIATDYIPTTTAAVSVGITADIPRLDYTGGGCPSLLLEPQRTNSAQYSEQTDNSFWLKSVCSITANQATAPDGTMSADLLTATAADAVIFKTGIAAGAMSFFIKVGTLSAGARFRISVDGVGSATWNQNGTLFAVTGGTATNAVDYGNGWYRCNYNVTSGNVLNYGLANNISGDTAFIWGIQNEASATYPTSYIPTLGSSVTRLADAASKTGISSLIGQTEGTLFLDFEGGPNDSIDYVYGINNGTTSNRIIIFRSSSNTIITQVRLGGDTQALIETATITANTRQKCAVAYKLNDVAFYVNGVQIGLVTSATIPTCSVLATNRGDGAGLFGRSINQAALFTTRLTNAELATLTSL